ncbi:hypothetical protein QC764_0055300 [Podospora pseudoanserina]|uniref:Uncharacterized protein n=1 Tax=Podospora pseudoanserina TaxID=2609844 RepID=A0ABR0IF00_9PEZI|nr:hypothetical protein QC764_0055300 [Podospora pseudoanserina]
MRHLWKRLTLALWHPALHFMQHTLGSSGLAIAGYGVLVKLRFGSRRLKRLKRMKNAEQVDWKTPGDQLLFKHCEDPMSPTHLPFSKEA